MEVKNEKIIIVGGRLDELPQLYLLCHDPDKHSVKNVCKVWCVMSFVKELTGWLVGMHLGSGGGGGSGLVHTLSIVFVHCKKIDIRK